MSRADLRWMAECSLVAIAVSSCSESSPLPRQPPPRCQRTTATRAAPTDLRDLSYELIEKTCELARVCGLGLLIGSRPTFAACVEGYVAQMTGGRIGGVINDPQRLAREVGCAQTSVTCDEWIACVTMGKAFDLCATRPPSMCDGDVALACNQYARVPVPLATDCAALGLECSPEERGCSDGDLDTCSDPTCARCPVGWSCEVHERNLGFCAPPGDECQGVAGGNDIVFSQTGIRCEGSVLIHCATGLDDPPFGPMGPSLEVPQREYRADCTVAGRSCVEGFLQGHAYCAARGTECEIDSAERCTADGTGITACGDGFAHVIDCSRFGRSSCVERFGMPDCQ